MPAWKLVPLMAVLALLGGCSTIQDAMGVEPKGTGAPVNTDSFCLIARPITWSKQDTPETAAQIVEHNAVGKRICGWDGHPVPIPQTVSK